MKNSNKKIAIIETGGSHDELIYPQLLFLKQSGHETHLIIRKNHLKRISLDQYADHVFTFPDDESLLVRIRNIRQLINYLKRFQIHQLVINTAQGAFIRDLSLFLPSKYSVTGISHNPHKIGRSFNQKLISKRIKKYFVLNDYIIKHIQTKNPDLSFQSFYAVFIPYIPVKKVHKELIISIPGAIDFNRRDYDLLYESLRKKTIHRNILFNFTGKCQSPEAKAFRQKMTDLLPKQCHFYDEFIPEKQFLDITGNADLLLPLITPHIPNFILYKKYKISGTINLSFGLKIPMLMHESLKGISDYQTSSFFFGGDNLVDLLNRLNKKKNLINEKKVEIAGEEKFQFLFQKKQYLQFLEQN